MEEFARMGRRTSRAFGHDPSLSLSTSSLEHIETL